MVQKEDSATSDKVCINCGLGVLEDRSITRRNFCLWKAGFCRDVLSKEDRKNGCKDFMAKVSGWDPRQHMEAKLRKFSIENEKSAKKRGEIAIVLSIIATLIALASIIISLFLR